MEKENFRGRKRPHFFIDFGRYSIPIKGWILVDAATLHLWSKLELGGL